MKRKVLSIYILTFFISISTVFSQEKKNIEDDYLEYFKLPRESLFLHTNKTTYLTGEEIWFKAYAYDRKNELTSKATTNVYLGIYDQFGKELDKKLYLAKEGAAIGNFAIDSTLASGDYFLKVSTNWMKNFKEDDSFLQKIKIINPKVYRQNKEEISQKEYDFQFLPEGGHIVYDVKNTIGIKVLNDLGKGTASTGSILNSKNEEVASFKSNFLGIGKFSFLPKKGETYIAKVTLDNGKDFEQSLPVIKEVGIAISVNNIRDSRTIITLSTNNKSISLFQEKEFKLLLHKDGKVKTIPVVFDKASKIIPIAQKDLFKGVNTITLFNSEGQPILERMFFNSASSKNYSLFVERVESDSDSITYQLKSNSNIGAELLDASVSVLPTQTVSYSPDHTIISALYLKPYLKGYIENPQYYFKDVDRKKKYELDALMVTQGWSRYSWDNIFNFPPKPNFDFENGVTINGGLNTNLEKVESLLLYPSKLNKSMFVPFDEKGKFTIKNYYPTIGEDIKFSYTDKKQRTKKPGMALSFIKFMDVDNVDTQSYQEFASFYSNKNDIPEGFLSKNTEKLDEVVVSTKLEFKKRKRYLLPYSGRLINIGKEEVMRYTNLSDFLNFNGFNVFVDPLSVQQFQITPQRRISGAPLFYLDNNVVLDPLTVIGRSITDFEDIFIDANPSGYNRSLSSGRRGLGFVSVVRLYSRRTPISRIDRSRSFQSFIKTNYGFEPKKEGYTPKSISYNIKPFKDYGVIHWEPSATIQKDVISLMNTINTRLDEVTFYIEGISSTGDLISQKITFDNKNFE